MLEGHFQEMCDKNLELCFYIGLVGKTHKTTTIFCSMMTDVCNEKRITREFDLHKRFLGSRKDLNEGLKSGRSETLRTDWNTENFFRSFRQLITKIMAEMLNKKSKAARKIFVED
jgi:hypothetical protein